MRLMFDFKHIPKYEDEIQILFYQFIKKFN